jgi:hypothetical protein
MMYKFREALGSVSPALWMVAVALLHVALHRGPATSPAHAAAVLQPYTAVNAAPYQWQGVGYTQITATSSPQALTAGTLTVIPAGTLCAMIWVTTANIRWRDDGIAPTTAIGVPQVVNTSAGGIPFWYCGVLASFSFIAQSGSPVLDVEFIQ